MDKITDANVIHESKMGNNGDKIAFMRNGDKLFHDNIYKIITVIIYLTAITVSFIALNFESALRLRELSVKVLLFATCSFIIYNIRFTTGKADGHETNDFKVVKETFLKLRERFVSKHGREILEKFIKEYKDSDLIKIRTEILENCGIEFKTYTEKYLKMTKKDLKQCSEINDKQKKAINMCNKIKPLKFDYESVVGNTVIFYKRTTPIAISPYMDERYRKTRKLIMILINVLIVGSITVQLAQAPTFATFVWALLNLIPIVASDIFGYSDGIYNTTVIELNNINSRIDIMKQIEN